MAHPVVHAEIRSADPDATRAFFAELFGWTYTDGAFPGYTFVDTGVDGALPTAISPLQGDGDAVLFFVGVADVQGTGTATYADGSHETLLYDTDMRFMQGVYVGQDGAVHKGAFGFV